MLLNKQLFILKLTSRNALYELYYLFIRLLVSSLSLCFGFCLFDVLLLVVLSFVSLFLFCQIVHVNITNNFAHTHTSHMYTDTLSKTHLHTVISGHHLPLYISTQSRRKEHGNLVLLSLVFNSLTNFKLPRTNVTSCCLI